MLLVGLVAAAIVGTGVVAGRAASRVLFTLSKNPSPMDPALIGLDATATLFVRTPGGDVRRMTITVVGLPDRAVPHFTGLIQSEPIGPFRPGELVQFDAAHVFGVLGA